MWMTLNFWSFCIYLQSAEFTGLCHHTWFVSALRKIRKTMTSQGLKIIFKKEWKKKKNNNKRMLFSLGPLGRCHLLYLSVVCFFWIKTGRASLSLPSHHAVFHEKRKKNKMLLLQSLQTTTWEGLTHIPHLHTARGETVTVSGSQVSHYLSH